MSNPGTESKSLTGGKTYLGLSPILIILVNVLLTVTLLYHFELAFIGGFVISGLNALLINLDFSNYWLAGKLLSAGDPVVIMTHETYFALAREFFGSEYQWHSWSYPPHYLLMVWPLSFLPYKIALLVFIVSTFALFVYSCKRLFGSEISKDRIFWIMLLPVIILNTVASQNGFLTSGLMLLGFAFRAEGRYIVAGFFIACLTVKPQLGVLIPIYLIVQKDWRTIVSASAFTLIFVISSALIFGVETWTAYLTVTTQYMSDLMASGTGVFVYMMPTFFMSARSIGLSADAAQFIQIVFSVSFFAFFIFAVKKAKDELTALFFLAAFTILVVPYAFNYDLCALVALGCAVHLRQSRLTTSKSESSPNGIIADLTVWLLALLPVVILNLARVGLPIGPIIVFAPALFFIFGERVMKTSLSSGRTCSKRRQANGEKAL